MLNNLTTTDKEFLARQLGQLAESRARGGDRCARMRALSRISVCQQVIAMKGKHSTWNMKQRWLSKVSAYLFLEVLDNALIQVPPLSVKDDPNRVGGI